MSVHPAGAARVVLAPLSTVMSATKKSPDVIEVGALIVSDSAPFPVLSPVELVRETIAAEAAGAKDKRKTNAMKEAKNRGMQKTVFIFSENLINEVTLILVYHLLNHEKMIHYLERKQYLE